MKPLPFLLLAPLTLTLPLAPLHANPLVDDAFSRVVAPGARVEKLAGSFSFTEGPTWNAGGFWVFSDIPTTSLFKITPVGQIALIRKPSGHSNGNAYDARGRLVCCEQDRRVSRKNEQGLFETVADRFEGKRLNAPNDLAIKSDGSIYFTDPTYGTPKAQLELDFRGLFRISAAGTLELLDKDWSQPNGLAFSPDEKTLYVDDSGTGKIFRYAVGASGTLTDKTLLATIPQPGVPDGMKTDAAGRLYVAGPSAIWIFAPRGGLLGKIPVPQTPTNLSFGGKDGKMLLITAQDAVYSVRLKVRGVRNK